MYKKVAIATLIIAPLIVDLASRSSPGAAPPTQAVATTAPPTPAPPAPVPPTLGPMAAPHPTTAQTGDPVPALDTRPALDTNPSLASAQPATLQPVPQAPTLGSAQAAPAQTPFDPTPISSEMRQPR